MLACDTEWTQDKSCLACCVVTEGYEGSAGPMCCSVPLLSDACSQALQADAADTGLQIASRLMTGACSTQRGNQPGLFLLRVRVSTDLSSDWMRLIT